MDENFSLNEDEQGESTKEHTEDEQQSEKTIDYEALSRDKKERETTERVDKEHDLEQANTILNSMSLDHMDFEEEQ